MTATARSRPPPSARKTSPRRRPTSAGRTKSLPGWASCAPTCALSRARFAGPHAGILLSGQRRPARRGRRENAAALLRGGGRHRRAHPLRRLHAAARRVGGVPRRPPPRFPARHVGAFDADRQRRGLAGLHAGAHARRWQPLPRCGTALRMGFAYCPACGAQVRRSCPACGHAAEDGWKVCPYCGRELPAPPADNAV